VPKRGFLKIMVTSDLDGPEYAIATDFLKRLKNAKSINQRNKLAIEFQASYLPGEARAVFELAPITRLPPSVRALLLFILRGIGWVVRRTRFFPVEELVERQVGALKWLLSLRRQAEGADFTGEALVDRIKIVGKVFLYKAPHQNRDLLVAFPARPGRFAPATPFFLDNFGQVGWDVLMVSPEPNQKSPWTEVKGIPQAFEGLIETIRNLADQNDYERLHTLGLSFSAPMALFTGIALDASTITPIGLSKGPAELSVDYPELWERLTRGTKSSTVRVPGRINFVAGSGNERDVQVARHMLEALTGSAMVLVDKGEHNPLPALMRRHQLQAFFRSLVSGFEDAKAGGQSLGGFTVVAQKESREERNSLSEETLPSI
jgi:hypothetical protein